MKKVFDLTGHLKIHMKKNLLHLTKLAPASFFLQEFFNVYPQISVLVHNFTRTNLKTIKFEILIQKNL